MTHVHSIRCWKRCLGCCIYGKVLTLETGWLAHFIRAAIEELENKRAGGESILSRLSELMFVEVVRRYLASLPGGTDRLAGRAA